MEDVVYVCRFIVTEWGRGADPARMTRSDKPLQAPPTARPEQIGTSTYGLEGEINI